MIRVTGLILCTMAGSAFAQPMDRAELPIAKPMAPAAPAPSPLPPGAPSDRASVLQLNEYTARSIARLALIDLRAAEQPGTADYLLGARLLGIAQDLTPEDQDILRWRMEAAWNGGDVQATLDQSTKALKLDPADTVALLRLVSARLAQEQDPDSRMARYDRILGAEGDKFDASVRSRLALDAALLSRERGEERAFIDRLTLAAKLDPTNKEAAALLVTYYTDQRRDDRVGRLELLSNLLLADPGDPNVHLTIARELASAGAYEQAATFHNNATIILAQGGSVPESSQIESLVLRWETKGPETVIAELNAAMVDQRDQASRMVKELERRGMPLEGVRKPEDVMLAPEFARTAILAADALRDEVGLKTYVREYGQAVAQMLQLMQDPATRLVDLTQETLNAQAAEYAADLTFMRMWMNVDTEQALTVLEGTSELGAMVLKSMPALEGWRRLRSGDAEGAIGVFESSDIDDLGSRVGLALSLEVAGRTLDAGTILKRLGEETALTPLGAWTRAKALKMGVARPVNPDPAILRVAAGIPRWVERSVRDPRSMVGFRLDLLDTTLEGTDRAMAKVRLQNLSDVPLALGSDRAINTRLLIGPRVENLPQGGVAIVRPEVIDVDRRLRLMPQERLEVDVWLDPGLTGWLIESIGTQNVRVRWRAVQGFVVDANGLYQPGPMCSAADTATLSRRTVNEAFLSPLDMAAKATRDPEFLLVRIAAALRSVSLWYVNPALLQPPAFEGDTAKRADYSIVAQALAARYPTLSQTARMMLVSSIPTSTFLPDLKLLDEAMLAEADPRVRVLVLASRISDPEHPALKAAMTDSDAFVAESASWIADRLTRPGQFVNRITPEIMLNLNPPAGAPELGASLGAGQGK
jgi:hypothetical protein